MTAIYHAAAAFFGLLAALEGVRAVSLLHARDEEASVAGSVTALFCSFALFFIVMARIDG